MYAGENDEAHKHISGPRAVENFEENRKARGRNRRRQKLEPSDAVLTNRIGGARMNKVRQTGTINATQFKAELWTVCSETSREGDANLKLDVPTQGQTCAFRPK